MILVFVLSFSKPKVQFPYTPHIVQKKESVGGGSCFFFFFFFLCFFILICSCFHSELKSLYVVVFISPYVSNEFPYINGFKTKLHHVRSNFIKECSDFFFILELIILYLTNIMTWKLYVMMSYLFYETFVSQESHDILRIYVWHMSWNACIKAIFRYFFFKCKWFFSCLMPQIVVLMDKMINNKSFGCLKYVFTNLGHFYEFLHGFFFFFVQNFSTIRIKILIFGSLN